MSTPESWPLSVRGGSRARLGQAARLVKAGRTVLLGLPRGSNIPVAQREQRRARNEARFREANEQLVLNQREILDEDDDRAAPFLWECPRQTCTDVILLTLTEYERIRSEPQRTVAKPGHEDRSIERVVETSDRYVVTEKVDAAAEVMDETDPSS